jgi:queuine/archaeosine tRNA-ribosyltransferase
MAAGKNKTDQIHLEQEDAIRAAQEYGIDVAMLLDNLKRSPAERIRRHQIALETVEQLRKAKRV